MLLATEWTQQSLAVSCNLLFQTRAATATKASKARALPKFWVTVNPISTRGADYAHHSTMGLVWLKFTVTPLQTEACLIKIQKGKTLHISGCVERNLWNLKLQKCDTKTVFHYK